MKSNIATTIEQSKKLLELGLSPDTADMWWQTSEEDLVYEKECPRLFAGKIPRYMAEYLIPIPAWSLSALLENIIPQEIVDGEYILNTTVGKCSKWIITYDDIEEDWKCAPGLVGLGNTLIDACVELIIKLKERKVI